MSRDRVFRISLPDGFHPPFHQPVGVVDPEQDPVDGIAVKAVMPGDLDILPVPVAASGSRPWPVHPGPRIFHATSSLNFHRRGIAPATACPPVHVLLVPDVVGAHPGMILVTIGQCFQKGLRVYPHILVVQAKTGRTCHGRCCRVPAVGFVPGSVLHHRVGILPESPFRGRTQDFGHDGLDPASSPARSSWRS